MFFRYTVKVVIKRDRTSDYSKVRYIESKSTAYLAYYIFKWIFLFGTYQQKTVVLYQNNDDGTVTMLKGGAKAKRPRRKK